MGTCAKCGGQFADTEMMMTGDGPLCKQCYAADIEPKPKTTPTMSIAGVIVGTLPFFLHFGTSSSVTVNGQTTTTSTNYVALGAGPGAVILGIVGVLMALKVEDPKSKQTGLGVGALAILLGLYQAILGSGLL